MGIGNRNRELRIYVLGIGIGIGNHLIPDSQFPIPIPNSDSRNRRTLMSKSWYSELMTFLMALAMGTMLSVTIFQLIPEALDLLHQKSFRILCNDYSGTKSGSSRSLYFPRKAGQDSCETVCVVNDVAADQFCNEYIGGPSEYIWVMTTAYVFTLIFYDIQKCFQYFFSRKPKVPVLLQNDSI